MITTPRHSQHTSVPALCSTLSLTEPQWASTRVHHSFRGTASNGMVFREAARSRDMALYTRSPDMPIRVRHGAPDTDRRSPPDARHCDSHVQYSDDSDETSR